MIKNLNRFSKGWRGGLTDLLTIKQFTGLFTKGKFISRLGGAKGHFVVVETLEKGIVKFWDPADALMHKMPVKEFLEISSGFIYR